MAEKETLEAKNREAERVAIADCQETYDQFVERLKNNFRTVAKEKGATPSFSPVTLPSSCPSNMVIAEMSMGTNAAWHFEVLLTPSMPPGIWAGALGDCSNHAYPAVSLRRRGNEIRIVISEPPRSHRRNLYWCGRGC